MNKNNDSAAMTLSWAALLAPLFLSSIAGCGYPRPADVQLTSAFFCDIEKGRECATPEDVMMGVNLVMPDVQGFWNDRKGYGLDFSLAATGACGGMPQKVIFEGPFPDGVSYCATPDFVGPGGKHPTVTAACIARCEENDLSSDCQNAARASHRADRLIPDACTYSGALKPDFRDVRILPRPNNVIWTNTVNVQPFGDGNSLRKTSSTNAYDAGAAASSPLHAGQDGAFEFTATETNRERAAGFARGPLPDIDTSDADIFYRVVLRAGGVLEIFEASQRLYIGNYPAGSRVRMVVGGEKIHYYLNQVHLTSGSDIGPMDLHVSVSLRGANATIENASITF
jgi:hypothetical protein